jgi:integrase
MDDKKPGAVLFLTEHGLQMGNDYSRKHIQNPVREAAGIPDLTLRQGRCTSATLIEGDVADVRDMLGHASAETTLRHYEKAISARMERTVEDLDRRLTQHPGLRVISGGKR